MSQKYNGWTNFETWKVFLEVFSDWDYEEQGPVTASYVRKYVEEAFCLDALPMLVQGVVVAFLSEVDYWEIADAINEGYD